MDGGMLCGHGQSLWERYHGCHMDALWEWMKSHLDVIMVGTWMLCGNGWRDALREWIEFVGTLPGLPHGCFVGMDRVCGNVIMVGTWMLCGNG